MSSRFDFTDRSTLNRRSLCSSVKENADTSWTGSIPYCGLIFLGIMLVQFRAINVGGACGPNISPQQVRGAVTLCAAIAPAGSMPDSNSYFRSHQANGGSVTNRDTMIRGLAAAIRPFDGSVMRGCPSIRLSPLPPRIHQNSDSAEISLFLVLESLFVPEDSLLFQKNSLFRCVGNLIRKSLNLRRH
jgi:hypothetical protein